jgi:hypothetical protein
MTYERVVQWTAGPVSIIAGWLATQITTHFGVFGGLGLGKSAVAHAIVVGTTFAVGAGVTYAAHHKWMSNLTMWWNRPQTQAIAGSLVPYASGVLALGSGGKLDPDPGFVLKEIDDVDAALTKLLATPGTPAAEVVAGLAPTPVQVPA